MTSPENPRDQELLSIRQGNILRALTLVNRSIWSGVPTYSRIAFDDLVVQYEKGRDVDSHLFWAQYKDTIVTSLDGMRAQAREVLVEDAFTMLLKEARNSPEKAVFVPLFPISDNDGEAEPSLLDIYKHEEEALASKLSNIHDLARADIIRALTGQDRNQPFIFLPHGDHLKTFVKGPGKSATFRVPTIVPSVDLRFIQEPNRIDMKIEIISSPIAA